MKRLNTKGFSVVELLVIVIVIAVIGGVGYVVYSRQNKQAVSQSGSGGNQNTTQQTTLPADYTSFSVEGTGKLTDKGKCKSGEVLFARIYNSSTDDMSEYEYECSGPLDAIQYTSVVLGKRDSSVVSVFSKSAQTGTEVTLASGVKVTKYTFVGDRKGHGTSQMLPTRYTIYEATDGTDFFYALYWTGVGFSDENDYLDDFNNLALKNWQVK